MKKSILLSIYFLLGVVPSSFSQSNCCTRYNLVPGVYATGPLSPPAAPDLVDDVSCSCLNGEGGSLWLSFSAVTSGTFEMMISPTLQPEPNYDFAIWARDCPCGLASSPPSFYSIACNSVAGIGPTGIAQDPMASFGQPLTPEWENTINLVAGTNYFLLVSNVDDNGFPFDIAIGGTAVLAEQVLNPFGVTISGPTQVCPGGTVTYTATSNTSFGPNYFAWRLGQTNTFPINMNTGSDPTIQLTFPTTPGTYNVCVEATNEFALGCFPSAPACLTVTVADTPVPAAYESGIVCTGSEYVAGNGDVFYFGGTFDLIYQSTQGCDSIVRLTLQQKLSNLTVTVKEVCAGDCVDWGGQTYCDDGIYDDVQQNQFGCDSINQLLLISVPIETVVNGADTIDCNNTSVTLTSTGSIFSANPIYTWKKGSTVVGNGPSLTVTTEGTYTLTISSTVTGKTCTDMASVVIVKNTLPPQGVIATGGATDCINSQVTLMGSSTTAGVTYHWTGPNGFASDLQNPTAGAPGNYLLTVTGTNGCTKTATAVVTENKVQPAAAAAANGTLNCNAMSIQLSGAGSSSGVQFTYLWTTSDGNITAGENTLAPTVNQGGTYLLTVTNNNNGCTNTASATVTEFPPIGVTVTASANVLCFGGATGMATVGTSGGDGSYTYLWSNGATTATVTNFIAGNYTVVVTDGNGCTSSQSVNISQPAILVPNTTSTPQTAFGIDDGTATASPTGGTGGYTYLWSNGETTQAITGLSPANYTVVVTDANGCTASQTVTVSEVACNVHATFEQTNVSCSGAADGAATINLENATAPIIYLWSNGATTQTSTGLAGGTYEVSATDVDGCEVVTTVVITEPQTLNANATATNLTAFDANDGTATVNPNGGTAPYSFSWDNGEMAPSIFGLAPGAYTVVVTDGNGCEAMQTVTVGQFLCTISANIIASDVSCNGASDGQATFSLTGGNAPFTYEWSNGETTATITGLPAGTYIGTATDQSNCPAVAEATVTEPAALGVQVVDMVEAGCGAADGQLTVSGTGGIPGYTYLWVSGETTPTVTGLTAGTHQVSITDANGCTDQFEMALGTNDNDIVPPTIDCPDDLMVPSCAGIATFAATATDNCSNVDITQTTGLPSGSNFPLGNSTVSFMATDADGNSSNCSFVVTVESNILLNINKVDVKCFGENSGSATATATGVLPPITYQWSNGATTQIITGLVMGTYNVTVMDAGGCTAEQSVNIGQPPAFNTILVTIVNSDINQANGSIDVTVSGGVPPYTYIWKDSTGTVIGNMEDISGLSKGNYSLMATDANGCPSQSGYTIQNAVGTYESLLDSHVLLYPNPTSGVVTLELVGVANFGTVEVTAFDVTGRQVLYSSDTNSKQLLDFKRNPSGVYMLKIMIAGQVLTKRIVVTR